MRLLAAPSIRALSTSMHIALVHSFYQERNVEAYLRGLRTALGAAGATVELVRFWELELVAGCGKPLVVRRDGTPFTPDVVLSRNLRNPVGNAVIDALEAGGLPIVNNPHSARRAGDKLVTAIALHTASIPVVPTALLLAGANWTDRLADMWALPLVVKPQRGSRGHGIELARSPEELAALAKRQPPDEPWIAQPFTEGCDVRVVVVEGVAVAAMRREPPPGEWRANLHVGASGFPHKLTADERLLCERAAEICGLVFCGVDLLVTADGPTILEVNPSPGHGIIDVTGVDVTQHIAKAVWARAR